MQNDGETVTRHYTVDYLSIANRDIFVTEDGSYTTRYVYDASGRRISAEFDYAPGTKRGEAGENLQSDIAVEIGKVFYRTSILGSTLFAVDKDGNQIAHAIYDPWGKPLTETYTDANYSGLENLNNYTGYTWDLTLALYFAQNRFYDADTHRFTQEDWAKSGVNWYVYCYNRPTTMVDYWGLNPTDDLKNLDLTTIRGIYHDGAEYYAARDIFTALGGTVTWDSTTKIATFSITGADGKTLTITVDQTQGNRLDSGGFKIECLGAVSGSASGYAFIQHINGTNYISYTELLSYFEKVWCAEETDFGYLDLDPTENKNPNEDIDNRILTEEEKMFIAIVAAESAAEPSKCWEAVAQIIINRLKYPRDAWKNAKSITDIITTPSQFSSYKNKNYNLAMEYLNNRDGKHKKYEQIIETVIPYYDGTKVMDELDRVVLYYSPKSMKEGKKPNWNFNLLVEVKVAGIDPNAFRFYKYK